MAEAFQMGEAVKPTEDTPPPNLYEQLAEIPDYIFDDTKPPFHSSYDNWHVFGVRTTPISPLPRNPSDSSIETPWSFTSHSAKETESRSWEGNGEEVRIPVVARISSHTLRLEREFHIVNNIMQKSDPHCQRVVRPLDLIYLPASGLIVSIFESPGPNYLGGIVNLTNATPNEPIPLPLFLDFAIGACECLELLSSENIVHGEIRGDAFHFNKENGAVKLINFGSGPRSFDHGLNNAIWSSVSKQVGIIDKLFFISPEQTGRMPAPPDSRTDIYSTGILFYTILTNQLVFDVGSPMEVVQSVLTRRVPLAHTRRMDVPETLSLIIQKMTAKQIDDRYHSASGLKHDLLEVKRRMATGDLDSLHNFKIGTKDITYVFTLPATMVGRQWEQEEIVRVLERAARARKAATKISSVKDFADTRTSRADTVDSSSAVEVITKDEGSAGGANDNSDKACNIVAIVGNGGMGKSSLVTNVLVEARRRGYFASAKFDQSHKSPFAPVLRVINSIFEQVLTESEEIVGDFYHSVCNAFQRQALPLHKMKIDLPALEYILNAAPQASPGPVKESSPEPTKALIVKRGLSTRMPPALKSETQKTPEMKFTAVSLDVLRILAKRKFVCLWLDDLQFADDESLQLLSAIVAANIQITLILTYRPGEILAEKLEGILDPERANVTTIKLGPLSEEDVIEYVSLTLYRPADNIIPLVAVVQAKAGGNPFYMREMLNMLHRKGCITFSRSTLTWTYDLSRVFHVLESDSPEEMLDNTFIVRRLQELPKDARVFLAWSSLLGTTFSFKYVKKLLAHISEEENPIDAVNGLQSSIQACIVVATDDEDVFRFSHDRYLQAAGEIQEREHAAEMHLAIARMMMRDEDDASADPYARSDHICEATDLLKSQFPIRKPFRKAVVRAAKKASESGAYRAAVRYYRNAIALLQENPWEDKEDCVYMETLELHYRLAESLWHLGEEDEALETLGIIFVSTRRPLDGANARLLEGRIYRQRGKLKAALDAFITALRDRGLDIEDNPSLERIDELFMQVRNELDSPDGVKKLLAAGVADTSILAAGSPLMEAVSASFWCDYKMFYYLTVKMVMLCLEHGFFSQVGMGVSLLGAMAVSRFKMISFACKLGEAATALLQQSADPLTMSRGLIIHTTTIRHLTQPLGSDLADLEEASRQLAAVGDKAQVVLAMALTAFIKLGPVTDLHEILSYCTYVSNSVPGFHERIEGATVLLGLRQTVEALMGHTDSSSPDTLMSTANFDSEVYLASITSELGQKFYRCSRICAFYMFGYYERAREDGIFCLDGMNRFITFRHSRFAVFFHALSTLEILRSNPGHADYQTMLDGVKGDLSLLKDWSEVSDVNYYMWVQVISAELLDLEGEFDKAAKCYELALDHCETHNFALDEALTSELAAKSYYRRGLKRVARAFFHEAIRGYTQLGATAKATQLSQTYGNILSKRSKVSTEDTGCQTETVLRDFFHHTLQEPEKSPSVSQVREPLHNRSRDQSIDRPIKQRSDSFISESEEPAVDGGLAHFTLDALDLNNIIKSSQVISSEVDMNILLTRMCEIVLDSAGSQADLAAIVVKEADQYVVSAMGGSDIGVHSFKPGVPVEKMESELSKPVIFYVLRTRKTVFLHNIIEDERFSNPDKAWMAKNPGSKSVIALPIIHETLLGVLYVEGLVESFTNRNLVVLSYLTSQIGISIKNALLFQRVRNISLANHALIESQKQALQNAKESEKRAKQATEDAIRMMKLKEDASKAKSEFLANVSHELRTPLSGVIGLTELLRDTNMTKEQTELSDSIRLCADTLLTVINDILDFSKIEAGKMKLSIVGFDMEECIRDVIRALTKANMGKKSLQVIEKIKLGFDTPVFGDPIRLRQVLMNVLSNSFKFCQEGSITIEAIRQEESASTIKVRISVADTGIGIDDYTIKLLFTPFSQADTSTARRYGGTGLGLSICKHLVEMMGGSIWLESEVGKGTTVYFTLTLTKAQPDSTPTLLYPENGVAVHPYAPTLVDATNAATHTLNLQQTTNHEPDPDNVKVITKGERFRVLIAEDNPINQKIAVTFVEKMDMDVKAVGNGVEALDELRNRAKEGKPYHLVLMDVQMPIMDGYEATKTLRGEENEAVRDVTVIAMTASAIQGDKERCLDVGMNDYLAKPVRSTMLRAKLDRYLKVIDEEGREVSPSRESGVSEEIVSAEDAAPSESTAPSEELGSSDETQTQPNKDAAPSKATTPLDEATVSKETAPSETIAPSEETVLQKEAALPAESIPSKESVLPVPLSKSASATDTERPQTPAKQPQIRSKRSQTLVERVPTPVVPNGISAKKKG